MWRRRIAPPPHPPRTTPPHPPPPTGIPLSARGLCGSVASRANVMRATPAPAEDTLSGGSRMKRSTHRILTTHTGSLPRPDDLVTLMRAKEGGELHDQAVFNARVTPAVAEAVRKQVEAGVDVVNDGEMSKPSYSTYVKN